MESMEEGESEEMICEKMAADILKGDTRPPSTPLCVSLWNVLIKIKRVFQMEKELKD